MPQPYSRTALLIEWRAAVRLLRVFLGRGSLLPFQRKGMTHRAAIQVTGPFKSPSPAEGEALRALDRWINRRELRITELLSNEARRLGRRVLDAPPESRFGIP